MKTFLLATGASLLAIVAAGPAAAQATRALIIEQVEVEHGDLDLKTTADAEAMLVRLSDAASDACGGKPRQRHADPLGPAKQRAYLLCKVAAIDAATLSLGAPLVRGIWLENGEAIRFAEEARRTASDLLEVARADGLAVPSRNE